MRSLVRKAGDVFATWDALLAGLLVITFVAASGTSSAFLSDSNLLTAGGDFSERALMALPLTLIVILGEIDLSIASILGLSSVVFGVMIDAGVPLGAAIVLCLLVGAACGALNGALVVRFGLPSLVVTIGTLALFRGIANGVIGTREVSDFPSAVGSFGYDYVPGTLVPWSVLLFAVVFVPFAFVLHATRFGRSVYAIGASREAARFAGIRGDRIRFLLFVLSGVVCSLAGLMLTARLGIARADNGVGYELDVVAVVLLGGVSIFGGRGNLLGVLLATVLVLSLQNSLSLNDVSSNVQQIVVGSLLILSVVVAIGSRTLQDRWRSRAASRTG